MTLACRLLATLAAFSPVSTHAATAAEAIRPKVVVITFFENGADTGDKPGEFQHWVEREKLDTLLPFPAGQQALRLNAEGTLLGICTGMGTARSTASIMALGLDPRFDLSRTYFLIAGIAGVDAADASLGSAAWAEWVVDGDLAHEIDAREMPAGWTTGYIPLRRHHPYEKPATAPPAPPTASFPRWSSGRISSPRTRRSTTLQPWPNAAPSTPTPPPANARPSC